ncbi:SHSP domain-containing protein [Plasmodiophora brassicae]
MQLALSGEHSEQKSAWECSQRMFRVTPRKNVPGNVPRLLLWGGSGDCTVKQKNFKVIEEKREKEEEHQPTPMSLQLWDSLFDTTPFERRLMPRQPGDAVQAPVLKMEFKEKDKSYALTVETPGTSKDDVKLKIENGVLTVSAERKEEKVGEKEHVHFSERIYGQTSRSIRLPKNINADQVTAKYENGMLFVDIPKREGTPTSNYIAIE